MLGRVFVLVTCLVALTSATSVTFTSIRFPQTFLVPDGVTRITVDAYGAAGGSESADNQLRGLGGHTRATINVTPGEVLGIWVGEHGGVYHGRPRSAVPAFGGGGAPNGGGASDVRQGGFGLEHRVVIAGGGGGVGLGTRGEDGGHGGGLSSVSSLPGTCSGWGGNQQEGYAPGQGGPGDTYVTIYGGTLRAGGGGGGLWGGYGGLFANTSDPLGSVCGGGGGSSFAIPGAANVLLEQGTRWGDGQVTLTWAAATKTSIGYSAAGTTVNVTARVEPSDRRQPLPTGLLYFFDGPTAVAIVSLDSAARATKSFTFAAGTTHSLWAFYGNNLHHEASSSDWITVAV